MKSELVNMVHEVGYIVLVTISLVVLCLLVFPLFIALLPIIVVTGCLTIWHLDHQQNQKSNIR